MAFCTKCGALLEEDESFCGKCGAPAEQKSPGKRCGFCGNLTEEGLRYCSYCGADLEEPVKEETANSTPSTAMGSRQVPSLGGNVNTYSAPYTGAFASAEGGGSASSPSRQEPSCPERELYRRGTVTLSSSMLLPSGSLTITTHRLVFKPWKIHVTSKPVELPISRIQSAQTAKTMVAIPGAIKVVATDGKSYTFTFGAMYAAEAERAADALRQALFGDVAK